MSAEHFYVVVHAVAAAAYLIDIINHGPEAVEQIVNFLRLS